MEVARQSAMQFQKARKYRPVVNITTYNVTTEGFANVEFFLMKKSKETTSMESIRKNLIYHVWETTIEYCCGDQVEFDMFTASKRNGPPEYFLLSVPEMLLNLVTDIFTDLGTVTLHDEKTNTYFRLGFRKHTEDVNRPPKKEDEGNCWGHVVAYSDCTKPEGEGKIQLAVYKLMEGNWKKLDVKDGKMRKFHMAFKPRKEASDLQFHKMHKLKHIVVDGDPNQTCKLHLAEAYVMDDGNLFLTNICVHCYNLYPCNRNCTKKKMKGGSSKEQKIIDEENAKKRRRMDELGAANRKAKAGPPPGF